MQEEKKTNQFMNISIISNIILEPFLRLSIKQYFIECETKIYLIPYGEHMEQEYLTQLSVSDQIIVWLNLESLLQTFGSSTNFIKLEIKDINKVLEICEFLFSDITQNSNAQILWFLFEDYDTKISITTGHIYDSLVDEINLKLSNQLSNRVDYIDLKRMIANVGISNAYNPKGKCRWNAPYSKVLVDTVAQELYKQYQISKGFSKKCLVLDCDNVLWGGILSEDGIENLQLGSNGFGRVYQDFQRFVLSLYHHGVILAICSKNSLSDVRRMFREHSEMILKEKHISCFQVNWNNKPNNIKNISEIFNIGLYDIAFIDDSVIEIEAVKSMLPEVTTILYEQYNVYTKFSCFNLKSNIDISNNEKRNETYRTNQYRKKLKSQYENYGEYIKALEIKLDIHLAKPTEYARISELTQRTNKCTNGVRYTVPEIKNKVISNELMLYSVSLKDRFSDLGIVGALGIKGDVLILFSLSCRALGRDVDKKMAEFTFDKYQIKEILFKSTGKNEEVKTLLLEFLSGNGMNYSKST